MRLQLIALAISAAQGAEPTRLVEAGGSVDTYQDEWITVVGPAAKLEAVIHGDWTVGASWGADFVSGATPLITTDIVSSATQFVDVRNNPAVTVSLAPEDTWSTRASYAASLEPDYVAHVAGLGASTDALSRMVTLRADYHLRLETAGRADVSDYAARAVGHTLDLGWAQILGRTTTLTALATGQWDDCSDTLGCQANAYRRVLADGVVLSERHPATRARGAAALRLSQAIGATTALHGGYRFYADAWDVSGHTGDLGVAQALLGDRLTLRATGRFSSQSAASFWRASYAGTPMWRTGDRELGELVSWLAGASADWSFFGIGGLRRLGISARVDRMWFHYPSDPFVPERNAWLVGGGLDVDF